MAARAPLRVLVSSIAFVVCFLLPYSSVAATKIASVQVKRLDTGVGVDLIFDKPVSAKSLKPTYERNFVQFALKSTQMDSARMSPVIGSEITKVFAYPYSQDVARVRLILKGDGKWPKGRLSVWNNNPRSVRIFIKEARPVAIKSVAPAERPVPKAAPESQIVSEETKLLKEVISNTRDIDIHNPDSVKAALDGTSKSALRPKAEPSSNNDEQPIVAKEAGPVGNPSDPSRHFARMALALFGVLAFFVACVLLLRRYASKIKRLPFGKKERLIQVVASHYLGNKKSISLVKVTGEYMVVGVSNEGISLISKLGPEVNVDKYLEDRFWGGTFEKHLKTYSNDSKIMKEIDLSDVPKEAAPASALPKFAFDGARDLAAPDAVPAPEKTLVSSVRTSIKEKLMNLKPLAGDVKNARA